MGDTPTRLIIVCCHGIWLGGPSIGASEAEWLIAPFQHGETPTFTQHIQAGLRLLTSTPDSLLIFSGGPTRTETRSSEAQSYLQLAQAHGYWGLLSPSSLTSRITLEERALDSFHNVLFSLTKFYSLNSAWPSHVTIVSNQFKRARFLDLHCEGLGWPRERVSFVGIDPDYMTTDPARAESVREGERRNGFSLWEKDLLGLGEQLERKRRERNVWRIKQGLFEDEEARKNSDIKYRFLLHREVLDKGPQPWH